MSTIKLVLISYWDKSVTKLNWAYVTEGELYEINLIRQSRGLVPATKWINTEVDQLI